MTESNQGPATPGTAARCEVCNRDLAAEPHDAFDSQCARDGIWRLKAENASLLESLRAAEKERDGARRIYTDYSARLESMRGERDAAEQRAEAAEKRNTELQGALRAASEVEAHRVRAWQSVMEGACNGCGGVRNWSLNNQVQAYCAACDDAFANTRKARAALHDEERLATSAASAAPDSLSNSAAQGEEK